MTPKDPSRELQPRSMLSAWIGVVLLFAFFGLLALVVVGAAPRGSTYETKRAEARAQKLQAAREEASKALTTYGWVDKTKGVVRIPISEAMRITVAELARKAPAPANPIAAEATPPVQNATPPVASPAQSPTANVSGTPKPTATAGQNSESGSPAATAPGSSPSSSATSTPLPAHGRTP